MAGTWPGPGYRAGWLVHGQVLVIGLAGTLRGPGYRAGWPGYRTGWLVHYEVLVIGLAGRAIGLAGWFMARSWL